MTSAGTRARFADSDRRRFDRTLDRGRLPELFVARGSFFQKSEHLREAGAGV